MSNTIDDYYNSYNDEIERLTNLRIVATSIASSYGKDSDGNQLSSSSYVAPVLNAMVGFALWKIELEQNEQLIRDIEEYINSLAGSSTPDYSTVDGIIAAQQQQDLNQLESLANSLSDAQESVNTSV